MRIENLPFYWRLKERGSPNIVPDQRPFEFDFVESLQLLIQKRDALTLEYLEEIYKAEYNIGYLQDGNEIAKPYGKDFMEFIERSLATWGSHVQTVLEVGCGGCAILEQLQQKGFAAIGVDPSPIAARDGARKGIRIINEFFPSPLFTAKVDLIFHSDVQEHVADPVTFLADQRKQLADNGLILISLPDCNESIAIGDLSMAMHQHLNYFDTESLRRTVEAAGLKVLTIEVAKYGGSLYCCAQNAPGQSTVAKSGRAKFESFKAKLNQNVKTVGSMVNSALGDTSRTVGFYAPLRALPYVAAVGRSGGFRFFDDTQLWYDRAFDGMEIYIENFADLRRSPVTDLFIMSLTFGDVIKKKVEREQIAVERITLLRDMLS